MLSTAEALDDGGAAPQAGLMSLDDVAESDGGAFNEYVDLSLEELMSLNVSSVTGVEQDWFTTTAAAYVITAEDIRRTGHLLLPEVLRLAPGMSVQRINSDKWAISARGFANRYTNKLQVLIDGRVVYDPAFSGTFWESQSVLLEDVERIEVIRGPGATLWGANAVNGVINVTSRSARDTQGLYLSAAAGTEPRGFGAFRYGDALGDDTWYRVWTSYYSEDTFDRAGGGDSADDWDLTNGGFRLDHRGADDTTFTFQTGFSATDRLGEAAIMPHPSVPFTSIVVRQDRSYYNGYLLGRVEQRNDNAGWSLQAYYDATRSELDSGFRIGRDTADIDWRHNFHLGDRNQVVWGLGYRHSADDSRADEALGFDSADRNANTYSAFLQDTVTLVPDRLFVMVGSKFEHNDYTGFEVQPSVRGWWTPNDRHTLWAAVSRAVRTPSRTDQDVIYTRMYGDAGVLGGGAPNGILVPLSILGNDSVASEELIAWEMGHRVRVTDDLSVDTALFLNDYDHLAVVGDDRMFHNTGEARSYGAEVNAVWRTADNWRLEASYSVIDFTNLHGYDSTSGISAPQQQFQVRSYLDITEDLELNAALYFVDEDDDNGAEDYVRLDVGVTWRPQPNLEIALWGQNLLDDRHVEILESTEPSASEVPRGAYLRATLRF